MRKCENAEMLHFLIFSFPHFLILIFSYSHISHLFPLRSSLFALPSHLFAPRSNLFPPRSNLLALRSHLASTM